MKKVVLVVALLATVLTSATAQEGLRWGLQAGLNSSNYSISGFDSRLGFHIGMKAELPLNAQGTFLEFGALLSQKGAQIDAGSSGEIKMTPVYLEVPIHIGYKYQVNNDFAIFGSAGPYVALGLFGKAKVEAEGEKESADYFGSDGFDRLDLGVGLKAGIEFSRKYQVSIGYDWGLIETAKDTDIKNKNLMISFAYMF